MDEHLPGNGHQEEPRVTRRRATWVVPELIELDVRGDTKGAGLPGGTEGQGYSVVAPSS